MAKQVRHTYWKNTLLDLFTEKRTEFNIIYEDEWVWVIDDKYPKSILHWLVIPKIKLIHGLDDLTHEHLPLLIHMKNVVTELIATATARHEFLVGFHKEPSLYQLHLHVLTSDLSKAKTARHRFTFSKEFLIPLETVISHFSGGGGKFGTG